MAVWRIDNSIPYIGSKMVNKHHLSVLIDPKKKPGMIGIVRKLDIGKAYSHFLVDEKIGSRG